MMSSAIAGEQTPPESIRFTRIKRTAEAAADMWRRLRGVPVRQGLRTLRPKFSAEAHGASLDLLLSELDRKDPARNVALSGPYGSGKSSILVELRRRKPKSVEIALATTAGLRSAITSGAPGASSASATTDALQKEIVKRLLYAENPAKLPRSQLNRIRGVNWPRLLWVSTVGATVLGLLAWVYEVPAPFAVLATRLSAVFAEFGVDAGAGIARVLDALLVFGALICVQWLISNVRLREVAVGEFKLTREDPHQNYFDQYLDEIVYFFARTKVRLVVFEDLDRFGEKGIFVALRELNVLLNNSAAITKPVTFIYAIRDSLFARDPAALLADPEGAAGAASDRAKFFDLIVPVVPFVSAEVAGGLLLNELNSFAEAERPDQELIRLVGTHFPDMRVILNMTNEFEVSVDRLIRKGKLPLDPTHLFAMVAYKHAYPQQYERIQFGASDLDTLFYRIEEQALARLAGLDHDIAVKSSELAKNAALISRAEEAAERLLSLVNLALATARVTRRNGIVGFEIDAGGLYEPDAPATPDFWRALDDNSAASLTVKLEDGTTVLLPRGPLNNALRFDLPAEQWLREVERSSQDELDQLLLTRRDLAHASLRDRLTDSRYVGIGFVAEREQVDIDFARTAREILGVGFALDLVSRGYVVENFTLYTSVYQDSLVSKRAQSFRIQSVSRRQSLPLAELTPADIQEIRDKLGDGFLEEASVLNVSIFDALLPSETLDAALDLIAAGELDPRQQFAAIYLAGGKEAARFVRKLAARADWVLRLIADDAELPEATRQALFGEALTALTIGRDYEATNGTERVLTILTRESLRGFGQQLTRDSARATASLLAIAKARIPDLRTLNEEALYAFGAVGAFEMTKGNLVCIAGTRGPIGLDTIGIRSRDTLRQVLARLPEYLAVIDAAGESWPSIDDGSNLDSLLPVLAEYGPSAVEEVLARSGADVVLAALPEAPGDELRASYPALAATEAFEPSASNVRVYLDVVGAIDRPLASYLTKHSELSGADLLEDDARQALAQLLLASAELEPTVLASLLKSLGVDGLLDPRRLKVARPDVAEMLLREAFIADDATTFTGMRGWEWAARQAAFAASKAAPTFIAELALNSPAVTALLVSAEIGPGLKRAILEDPDKIAVIADREGALAVLRAAITVGASLDSAQLLALKASGGPDNLIVEYLGTQARLVSDADMIGVLAGLGGDWPILATPSKSWRNYPALPGLDTLVARLKKIGLVSKASQTPSGKMRITMRPAP